MKKIISILAFVLALAPVSLIQASGEHDHDKDHDNEVKTEADHGHEDAPASVGPNKGITEFDEHSGFKLSAEAVKNFALKFQILSGKNSWSVPVSAILYSGEEINVFRVRNEFYKRVDFKVVSKDAKQTLIKSSDLQDGDQVVIEGVGFLRAAEIVVTEGAPEGHGH
ncbi:MAG: hypothetical protein ACKOX6_08410 [Bdellovibrio sp.]